jgi:hypothetical protein
VPHTANYTSDAPHCLRWALLKVRAVRRNPHCISDNVDLTCPHPRACRHGHDPCVALIFLKGNRYKPEGLPDGFITSFRVKGGRADLLLEVPFGPPAIREKR